MTDPTPPIQIPPDDERADGPGNAPNPGEPARRPGDVLYPDLYVWLIFAAAMDVLMTWTILVGFKGTEVNPLAAWIIEHTGHFGMVVFKLSMMILVILICEFIGRREPRTGRRLAIAAVVITFFPSVWSFALLLTQR